MPATVGLAAVARALRLLQRRREGHLLRACFAPELSECRGELRAAVECQREIDRLLNELADADGADLSPPAIPRKG